jgi:hypothetical protein
LNLCQYALWEYIRPVFMCTDKDAGREICKTENP